MTNRPILLASASPRRKALLEKASYVLEVLSSPYEEENLLETTPSNLVMKQAQGKACALQEFYKDTHIIIGADTIVALDGNILGKPKSREEGKAMLEALSGKTHSVFSGVCLIKSDYVDTFFVETKITFHKVTEMMINDYIKTGSPMDKAGAYGIQDLNEDWLAKIEGSYSNVVGLPMETLAIRLTAMGAACKGHI